MNDSKGLAGANSSTSTQTVDANGANAVTNEASKTDVNEASAKENKDPRYDDMGLKSIDQKFLYDCMSTPSKSYNECRMVVFVMLFARANNIKYEFDTFGNVYLTKGELDEGEYYPCVTSHLDTVQNGQLDYALAGANLIIKTEVVEKEGKKLHKMSVDTKGNGKIGIGADCKSGLAICMSMFSHLDKLKACFFLQEEVGMIGSKNLDVNWFKDVGYVIGFDSPELKRAAWKCSGTKLFSYKFYEEQIKEVCDKYGLKKCFNSEPYTDVIQIREKVGVMCMNFGNGGYEAHSSTEYCYAEEMDTACSMGIELVKHMGNERYMLDCVGSGIKPSNSVTETATCHVEKDSNDEAKLSELSSHGYYGGGYGGYSGGYRAPSSTATTVTKPRNLTNEEAINLDIVKYALGRYDSHIETLKNDLTEAIKAYCEDKNIDSDELTKIVDHVFSKEITF